MHAHALAMYKSSTTESVGKIETPGTKNCVMKFGKYLVSQREEEWTQEYVNYTALKRNIKVQAQAVEQLGVATPHSPRQTSLSVVKVYPDGTGEAAAERFFKLLEYEIEKIGQFTKQTVRELRVELVNLTKRVELFESSSIRSDAVREQLVAEAQRIGDEYLKLEKFVNLNYLAFHKILKKHDKLLPHVPCRQFYTPRLHHQPWVQGGYSDLLVSLSQVHSRLREDTTGNKNEDAAQGFIRSTTKYWVTTQNVSSVKHIVLQNLPVFQFDQNCDGDAQLVNSVYLDNSSMELYHSRLEKRPGALAIRLRWYGSGAASTVFVERKTHHESWKGEESVKERFVLQEHKVVPFLEGEYKIEEAQEDLRSLGKSEDEIRKFTSLFIEIQQVVDSKQLRPMIRTQYMRAAFQIPYDATVRISLDTNLAMIKENPHDGPTCLLAGRWYRDPNFPITRSEITRFPHAILEIKLSLSEGTAPPVWVQDLLHSGLLTEVHKFSKFIHGTSVLMSDMVQGVPYWIDDVSLRDSIQDSAPVVTQADISRMKQLQVHRETFDQLEGQYDIKQPLLGSDRKQSSNSDSTKNAVAVWMEKKYVEMLQKRDEKQSKVMRVEPKTFFANERTLLSWLHMAVTIGSIAAALLGYTSRAPKNSAIGAPSFHLVEVICLILLPVAVLMTGYALMTFTWRGKRILKKQASVIDDRVGPLFLGVIVIVALTAIFIISLIDTIITLKEQQQTA